MASKKYQILCQKCTDIKSKKSVKFRTKDQESQPDVIKQKKRGKTAWRKLSTTKQNCVRSPSRPGLHQMSARNKGLRGDSPYESACEADDCSCTMETPTVQVTPKCGILKRRSSSADAVDCYRNFDVPSFGISPHLIPEEAEDNGKSETFKVPSLEVFEEKRPKKIRFKIPEGTLGYEDAKKAMWRSDKDASGTNKENDRFMGIKGVPTKYPTTVGCNSLGSPSESIREILPVLERLKRDDELIESELDLNKIARYIKEENGKRKKLSKEEKEELSEDSEGDTAEEDSEMESDA